MAVLRPAGDFDRSYQQDKAIIRQNWQWLVLLVALAVVASIPLWGTAYLVNTVNRLAYLVVALQGLNILTGYTGQISLGQAAFMLVGGYLSALLVTRAGMSMFLALPLVALGTGVSGLVFGLPSLRVKGFYLAMATLAAQFIIPWITRYLFPEYLGGTAGRIAVPVPQLGSFAFNSGPRYLYISLVVVAITTILTVNMTRTRLGRAFVAIRDKDLAAELLGVNLFSYKLRAFFVAAALAGVAGAMRAHYQRAVGTELGYGLNESIIMLGMLVIGGLGSNLGPFFGAATVILIEDLANVVGRQLAVAFPDHAASLLTSFRPIFFGLVLMLFLIFEPRGLAHRWQLFKASWRLRPFSR
jgi:branched-chain amino acid transport system permease protein